jgi:kynureninase
MEDWARLAVEGHFRGRSPWYGYHDLFRETGARLVGASPGEVVMMNSLTVNLHLMMVSFYRPTEPRRRILMEWPAFPSDLYAIQTHLRSHGLDPEDALLIIRPREHEQVIRTEDIEATLDEHGPSIALILMSGVNYYTGQVLDMQAITELGHRHGCRVGFDLAHAAGNVPMRLHDWDVDFAAWCSYKYLNAGPGAIAGCFVHQRHGRDGSLPRLAGWWGNDPETRFRMHLEERFVPQRGADGWQVSNPPILAMAPLRASLDLFDEIGMEALRAKSRQLTGYLRYLIEQHPAGWFDIITPREPEAHGCQLSILLHDRPRQRFEALQRAGVVCDYREPNVIRVAPVPLYNTFQDVWRFADTLAGQPAA